ncbi:MAG: RHS repeat domain-containing protein [Spirochaetota bacterium]
MLYELVDDRAGNLTRQTDNAANRAKHMTYDHANRVTRVTNPATGETVGRYHYDDQGFRVRKTALDDDGVDRKETMLLYASMYFGVEIQKDVYTGEEIYNVMNNIYLNGVRVAAMVPTGEAAHFHTDQVDSVKVVTNDAGAVVSRMEYLPYGETWFREGDDRFAPKYNSQELDRESGYYFYNARYYDPEICRFVTADTVIDGEFDTQGWNRFAYAKGNPILYKDPTGHGAWGDPMLTALQNGEMDKTNTENREGYDHSVKSKLDNNLNAQAKGIKSKGALNSDTIRDEMLKNYKNVSWTDKSGEHTIATTTIGGVKTVLNNVSKNDIENTSDRTLKVLSDMATDKKLGLTEITIERTFRGDKDQYPHSDGRAVDITQVKSEKGIANFNSSRDKKESTLASEVTKWMRKNEDVSQVLTPWSINGEPNMNSSILEKQHQNHMHITVKPD